MEHYGEIPEGFEIHHKLPVRNGGDNDIDNLIALSRKDHSLAHKKLYEDCGDVKDLCAYYMLSGTFDRKSQSSIAGKIGGKKTYEEKLGIHNYTPELKRKWCSEAGKISGKLQAARGEGFHKYKTDPELHKSWASKGGINGILREEYYNKQGYTAEEAKQKIKKHQSEMGKRGGVKNKGAIWLNDGVRALKYTVKMQENQPVEEFLARNPQYSKGRPPRTWTTKKRN